MDYLAHFHREVEDFEAAARSALGADEAPTVPSCPDWTTSDLVLHLGWVHRSIAHVVRERRQDRPDWTDPALLALPAERDGWPTSLEETPTRGPLPSSLVDWFAEGAAGLAARFEERDPAERVWTWSKEQSVGFWHRMQTIEAAVHRWDAQNAIGTAQSIDGALAADAVAQTFEVMAPARRAWKDAPPGEGERIGFRRVDGPGEWAVHFDGDAVRLDNGTDGCDVELLGTASDLMLFLWRRISADQLDVRGDRERLDRYFTLVPPV